MEKEVWKDIIFFDKGKKWNFEGKYQISNFGNIKSKKRISANNRIVEEKILKTRYDKNGYEIITLRENQYEKQKDFKVHRLVAFMFIENKNPGKNTIVNHKDENKRNNHYKNLNWTNCKENNNFGTRNFKISKPIIQYDTNMLKIREWNSAFEVQKVLGFNSSSISKCCKNKIKTSKGYIWRYK